MTNRWLIAGLVGFTLVNSMAHAMMEVSPATKAAVDRVIKPLDEQAAKILRQVVNPNPMYRCFQFGRMQSFADILAIKIDRLNSATNFDKEAQALLLSEFQKRHLKIDRTLRTYTPDCDPAFRPNDNLSQEDLDSLVTNVKKKMAGVGAEDLVISCFHTGRLGMLTGRLAREYRKEKSRDQATEKILNDAKAVVRAKSKNCEATTS